ncbi:cystathionine beta-lyase [Lobulomyces angularis]|nr:cystathionine beta-lyase [Lobulomyces angularis]
MNGENISGLDNTLSTFGGAIMYQKVDDSSKVSFEHLEDIPLFKILLFNSNIEKDTQKQVAIVRDLVDRFPKVINPILESINEISEEILKTIKKEKDEKDLNNNVSILKKFEELFDFNHLLLTTLKVSHPKLDLIKKLNSDFGLKGCKITGAGGGGCMFTLIPEDFEEKKLKELKLNLNSIKVENFEANIGCEGLKVKSLKNSTNNHPQIQFLDSFFFTDISPPSFFDQHFLSFAREY